MISKLRLGAKQTLAIGFALIILIGAFLLMIPAASSNGQGITFINALFTSASATCVTGLVVFDTWTQFSFFGQFIILILIQIGALGFMTVAILFSIVLGKRIGLKERTFLMETVNAMQISGVVRLVRRILIGTLLFEGIGALVLAFRFYPYFGFPNNIWYGIFHSVSAFCNAGFDLMGIIEPYTSLTPFVSDYVINFTIISLIIIGGVGFVVWDNIFEHRFRFKNYNLHTKIVLSATVILIVFSTIMFLVLEKNTVFQDMPIHQRTIAALFQSVTPRTAGFNTVDTALLSEGGVLYTLFLMVIGAAPGSTAGGIKITTFVIVVLSVINHSRKKNDVNVFNRRLEEDLIKRAYSNTVFYVLVCMFGVFALTAIQDIPVKDALFESSSAIGTVGLSTGITRDLNDFSRIVIILLMYIGRLGSLTLFMAVAERRVHAQLKNPVEKIIIG